MTIKELFITSNETEQKVVEHIADHQWELMMPEKITRTPLSLLEVVRYHVWDSAWIPDGLAGKTIEEVGDSHDHLLKLTSEELKSNFARYNQRAARAFWSYDIAKLIGADFTLADDFVQALTEEFTPVVESYRQLGLFPPEVKVASDASPQTKLLAMVGRD